jgi:hypothetical protein
VDGRVWLGFFFFFVALGLELRASHLLGRRSTTWVTLPAQTMTFDLCFFHCIIFAGDIYFKVMCIRGRSQGRLIHIPAVLYVVNRNNLQKPHVILFHWVTVIIYHCGGEHGLSNAAWLKFHLCYLLGMWHWVCFLGERLEKKRWRQGGRIEETEKGNSEGKRREFLLSDVEYLILVMKWKNIEVLHWVAMPRSDLHPEMECIAIFPQWDLGNILLPFFFQWK